MNTLLKPDSYSGYQNTAHYEASQYHNEAKWGFFTLNLLRPDEHDKSKPTVKEQRQWSFPLSELADRLPEFIQKASRERKNLFISQASFRKWNRQRSSFLSVGCLYIDLDIYHSWEANQLSKTEVMDRVLKVCDMHCIPVPSIILNSGGGMYLKWMISNVVYKHGLSYWEAVQARLYETFRHLGADRQCLDVNRILRVVGSYNYKSKYIEPPMCEIMHVHYEDLSHSTVSRYSLDDFQPIMKWTLAESQQFIERMATNNKAFKKNGAAMNRQRNNRLLILECLRELDAGDQLDGMTPAKLNDYIKTTRQLTRFSLVDCGTYLPKFMQQKEVYERNAAKFGYKKDNGKADTVVNSAAKFRLVRRNWGSYQDILNLAEYRYHGEGVEDGKRDIFMFIACSQFALSNWYKKSTNDILTEFGNIGNILVPEWTESRLNSCVSSVVRRLGETKESANKGENKSTMFRFGDDYLHRQLEITSDELAIVNPDGTPLLSEILGEDERNRRDPERQAKEKERRRKADERRRRLDGGKTRAEHDASRKSQSADRAEQAKRFKAQGWKNEQIAFELGVHVKSVSRLLK